MFQKFLKSIVSLMMAMAFMPFVVAQSFAADHATVIMYTALGA